jgi:hypothetical protein
VAPVGDGLLIIIGPDEPGYLSRSFVVAKGAPKLDYVRQLPDGTLVGSDNQPGLSYLGKGVGWHRQWIRVVLSRQ